MTQKTLEQKIGIFFRDRKEAKEIKENIFEIMRTKGYQNKVFEGVFTDDVTLFGNPKKYALSYSFGNPLMEGSYALVPVNYYNSYTGTESASLALVDRASKKVVEVANEGERGVHYNGKCKLKPKVMSIVDGKAIISYEMVLNADLKNPIKVDNSIWEDYLFRHTEQRVMQFDLKKLEAAK